jgi:hypothetical protein
MTDRRLADPQKFAHIRGTWHRPVRERLIAGIGGRGQGLGDTNLLVPTAAGVREPQNRRVEIIIR